MGPDPQRVEEIITRAISLDVLSRAAWLDEASQGDASLRAWLEALVKARLQPPADRSRPTADPGIPSGAANGQPRPGSPDNDLHPSGSPNTNGDLTSSGGSINGRPSRRETPNSNESNATPRIPIVDRLAAKPDLRFPFLSPPGEPQSLGHLAGYEILEVLSQTETSVVFRAWDPALRRVVVIRVLNLDHEEAESRQRILDALRAAAAVRHENVIAIHAIGEKPVPYVVMDYIPGGTLQDRLTAGPLELRSILRIGAQIAAGLDAAHQQGLLHGTLELGNIRLENGLDRVTLTDFGVVPPRPDSPTFLAPEQVLSAELDDRADLFSLGTVLYLMCTGRPPFGENRAIATLKRIVEDSPRELRELNPDIPPWLCEIIGKLHAKLPADRYQSAGEVAHLLAHCLSEVQMYGGLNELPTAEAVPPPTRPRRAWRVFVAILGFLVIFGDLLAAYFFDLPPFRSPDPPPAATQSADDHGK